MKSGIYKTTAAHRRSVRQYTQRHANAIRDKARESQRERLLRFKAGLACIACGEEHPAALDFHHRNPKEKRFTVSNAVSRRDISDDEIWAEIAKCDVLCRNCHAKLHWNSASNGGGSGSRKLRGKRYDTGQLALL
jgi:DNA-directed RNA polymerase subunit M/transcription elongation factor TFIIS